jgi:hypothetical protein
MATQSNPDKAVPPKIRGLTMAEEKIRFVPVNGVRPKRWETINRIRTRAGKMPFFVD